MTRSKLETTGIFESLYRLLQILQPHSDSVRGSAVQCVDIETQVLRCKPSECSDDSIS